MRFGLLVPFPDGKNWQIDDRKGQWLVATHAATSSVLRVRVFRDDQPFNRKRCEERARSEDPSIPREDAGKLVEASDAPVMPGWDAHWFSVVAPMPLAKNAPPQPAALEAHHVVFAAQVRRCLVVHFGTRAPSPGAEAVVGARLGEMSELVKLLKLEDETAGPGREKPPFQ